MKQAKKRVKILKEGKKDQKRTKLTVEFKLEEEKDNSKFIEIDKGTFVSFENFKNNKCLWRVLLEEGVPVYDSDRVISKESYRLQPGEVVSGMQQGDWIQHDKGWSQWTSGDKLYLKMEQSAEWYEVHSTMGLMIRPARHRKNATAREKAHFISILPKGAKVLGTPTEDKEWLQHGECRYPVNPSSDAIKVMEKFPYLKGYSMIKKDDDNVYLKPTQVTVEEEKAHVERERMSQGIEKKKLPCISCGQESKKKKKKKKKEDQPELNIEKITEKNHRPTVLKRFSRKSTDVKATDDRMDLAEYDDDFSDSSDEEPQPEVKAKKKKKKKKDKKSEKRKSKTKRKSLEKRKKK